MMSRIISLAAARAWVSLLEAGYILFILPLGIGTFQNASSNRRNSTFLCDFSCIGFVYSLKIMLKLPAKTATGKRKMREDFSQYESLIKLMEATPKANVSEGFTDRIMSRLAEPKPDLWHLLKQAVHNGTDLTSIGIRREAMVGRESFFYFLIVGFFFFFIGATIMAGLFHSNNLFAVKIPILITAILILTAAFLLVAAGFVTASSLPATFVWAKRAILAYVVLIIISSFHIQSGIQTALGGLFALIFGTTGILMGIVLMKALKDQTNETMGR